MSMSETDAAESLRSTPEHEQTPVEPDPVVAAIAEKAEELEAEKAKVPRRRFKWIDDRNLTVENWLSGTAYADIEAFPGIVFRFVEAPNSALRDADALVNSMGPKFMLRGLVQESGARDDIPRTDQWARARNVAMVAVTISRMGGQPWPDGDSLAAKFAEIDKMGHVKVDRLIMAMSEFTSELAMMIGSADLPNS